MLAGPQGTKGQFAVECMLDHLGADDPIVHPGHAGMSHLHQFFGAVGVDADSTAGTLASGATRHATSTPTRLPTGRRCCSTNGGADPRRSARLRTTGAGPGVAPQDVADYPAGLMLIGGDSTATSPQPLAVAAWSCGTGAVRSATPLDCTGAASLRMIVTYPDCWNGRTLRAADWHDPAQRHAVYSEGGVCPAAHPVHIPQLQFAIDYPPVPADELAR